MKNVRQHEIQEVKGTNGSGSPKWPYNKLKGHLAFECLPRKVCVELIDLMLS